MCSQPSNIYSIRVGSLKFDAIEQQSPILRKRQYFYATCFAIKGYKKA